MYVSRKHRCDVETRLLSDETQRDVFAAAAGESDASTTDSVSQCNHRIFLRKSDST